MKAAAKTASHARWRTRASCVCAAAVLGLSLLGPAASAVWAAGATKSGAGARTSAPSAGSSGAKGATPEGSNGRAFNELSQGGQPETTQTHTQAQTTETNGTTTSSTTNSKKTVIIIVIAALILLVAIGYVIVRDARSMAPAGDPQAAEARSAHDSAAALRRRRAKAKAARQQRKRNR